MGLGIIQHKKTDENLLNKIDKVTKKRVKYNGQMGIQSIQIN